MFTCQNNWLCSSFQAPHQGCVAYNVSHRANTSARSFRKVVTNSAPDSRSRTKMFHHGVAFYKYIVVHKCYYPRKKCRIWDERISFYSNFGKFWGDFKLFLILQWWWKCVCVKVIHRIATDAYFNLALCFWLHCLCDCRLFVNHLKGTKHGVLKMKI